MRTPRAPQDLRIVISDETPDPIAYLTLADIVPSDAWGRADIIEFAELELLRPVVHDRISSYAGGVVFIRGTTRIRIFGDVLLRFAIKEAAYAGQEELKLHFKC